MHMAQMYMSALQMPKEFRPGALGQRGLEYRKAKEEGQVIFSPAPSSLPRAQPQAPCVDSREAG